MTDHRPNINILFSGLDKLYLPRARRRSAESHRKASANIAIATMLSLYYRKELPERNFVGMSVPEFTAYLDTWCSVGEEEAGRLTSIVYLWLTDYELR